MAEIKNFIKGKEKALLSNNNINKSIRLSCGRISSCFSEKLNGSMTVEACFVLPFFLFAFLSVMSIIEVYRFQGNMSTAIHDTIKQMSSLGYEYKDIKKENATKAESLGLTYIYAANKVKNILGEAYINNSPVYKGVSGISWLKSDIMTEDDCIDLEAWYLLKLCRLPMCSRLRTRAWTGYDNASADNMTEGNEELVYITPEGEVYHRSRSCTYLKLSVSAVDIGFIDEKRNENGEIYYACGECKGSNKEDIIGTVYITDYGNRYHTRLSCSKLKRTIMAVPISQVGGRGACSKCG